jgi:hypothetical protein
MKGREEKELGSRKDAKDAKKKYQGLAKTGFVEDSRMAADCFTLRTSCSQ